MPRSNIFKSKKLTLAYLPRNNHDKSPVILLKDDNESGSRYDIRGAYNLYKNINRELNSGEAHDSDFCLSDFFITDDVLGLIKDYESGLESKFSSK